MGLFRYEYLGPEVLAGFDTYKYSCRDTSPLSNYVMHPFWNQAVKVTLNLYPTGLYQSVLINNLPALPSLGRSQSSHSGWIYLLHRPLGSFGDHRL